jgi:kumamolisin
MAQQRFHLFGSSRPTAEAVGAADPDESLSATIYVRRDPKAPHPPAVREQGRLVPPARSYLRPEEGVAVFGAAEADLDAVAAFASEHGLQVQEESIAKRLVRVKGTVKQMNDAFDVDLRQYEHPRVGKYRAHEGDVKLPSELAEVVEGVLGLDNRKMIHSWLRSSGRELATKRRSETLPPNTYTPSTLAKLFGFPAGDGSGQCVAVLAFNGEVMSTGVSAPGGYDLEELEGYFTDVIGQQAPKLTDVVVQGPGNQPGDGSNPNDTTGEVLLDLCTIGAIVPAANVAVYFTEFTEEGWVNAIKAAVSDTVNKPAVISISYGNPEDDEAKGLWSGQAVKLINEAFEQAAAQGITVCCASGDNGSDDEPEATTDHVDFPASSPWVLGCGGIRLEADVATMTISAEQVWNDLASNEGASGGGVSRLFAQPDWQAGANVPPNADGSGKTGRGVPDVAGLADPETPLWVLTPGGKLGGVGGTSAAAPLWSGLLTLLAQLTGNRLGFLNPPLYESLNGSLVDIVTGNNGSYAARQGWDACTGWGRPDGARLLQALQAAVASAPPAPGAPTPAPAAPENAVPAPVAPAPAPPVTPEVPGLGTNLVGPQGQLFADPRPGGDEVGFQVDNTSDQYYKSPYYKLHCEQLQPVPAPRVSPPHIDLAGVIGRGPLAPRAAAKRIVFHVAGDTGPSSASHIETAASVADAMSAELAAAAGADAPAFLFHLGDVVYNFGEAQYYYDQFYEPYRAYDAPIFAIAGNHDMSPEVNKEGEESEEEKSLFAFLRNFCAATPGPSPDAGALVRTTMTQPGVYFTLEAPFVSIIGLCSNVLEGPGVISSEGGRYPIGDEQLQFLISELERLKPQREALQRAVILTCHHPPLSIDEKHGGARGLAEDIDKACEAAGLRPDAVLSGHAHLYQRYMRSVDGAEIPYIVSGSGGHNVTKPAASAAEASLPEGYALVVEPILDYGYLTLTVDMSGTAPILRMVFNATGGDAGALDTVTIDLERRRAV